MVKQDKYFEELQKYINTFTTCYYEEASSLAINPYCVVLPPSTTDLAYGDLMMFDIEVYSNERQGVEELEQLCDKLRNNLNDYLLNSANNFVSHVFFEGYYGSTEREHDLIVRKLTFSTRIFYM